MAINLIDYRAPRGSLGGDMESWEKIEALVVERLDPILVEELGMRKAGWRMYVSPENLEAVQLYQHVEYAGSSGLANPTEFVMRVISTNSQESRLVSRMNEAFPEFEKQIPKRD